MSKKKIGSPKKEQFKISGKVFWACIATPNALSNKFQLDLSVDKETAAKLEDLGIEIKTSEKDLEGRPENNRGRFVTLKSSYPPKLFDAKRQPVDGKTLIGNGSVCNIATHVYDWKFGRDSGSALGLDAIQIVKLVSFKDSTTSIFDEEDGFVSSDAHELFGESDKFDDEPAPTSVNDSPF